MHLNRPVSELIAERISVRAFQDMPITGNTREELEAVLAEATQGPFGSRMRLVLIGPSDENRAELSGLATYGFIHHAMGFVIGALTSGPHDMEDFGYVMEKIVLKCTDMGLGTCWVGGTFSKSSFAAKIGVTEHEYVPAVLPLGYAIAKPTASKSKRLPWEDLFFKGSKPLTRAAAGRYALPLEMVRLAPSAANYQPWRIIQGNDATVFHFYIKRARLNRFLIRLVSKFDLQRTDLGIAMAHFELTAREAGLDGDFRVADPHPRDAESSLKYVATWICKPCGA
jgi:nitroreductase